MKNNEGFRSNYLNEKINGSKKWKLNTKKIIASLVSILALSSNAKSSNTDVFIKDTDTTGKSSYTPYINIYGIDKNGDNSYNGIGAGVQTEKIKLKLEKGKDYFKGGGVIKVGGNKYIKLGAGNLNYSNYKINNQEFDINQTTAGIATGYKNPKYQIKIETGYLKSFLTKPIKENSSTTYIELVKRIKSNIGQLDLSGLYIYQSALGESKNYGEIKAEYYPTSDIELGIEANTENIYEEKAYEIGAGIQYRWGNNKGKLSPYIYGNYNNKSNIRTSVKYQKNIANEDLSWKDIFEDEIFTSAITAQNIAPEKFKEKIENTINNTNTDTDNSTDTDNTDIINNINPSVEIIASSTSIELGESITLSANANDPDGTIQSITWFDQNGNQIGTGNTITITPTSVGTFNYSVVVVDNNNASSSDSISIEVKDSEPTLSSIDVQDKTNIYYVNGPTKVGDNEYEITAGVDIRTSLGVLEITLNGNKGTETITISGYPYQTKTVTSNTYGTTITVYFKP